jgi:hopanoid C-3 methylase
VPDLIWSMVSTEKAVEELEEIQEPGVFLADDVAFI